MVFWHAKGWTIFQSLIAYMRRRLTGDYEEVNAPQILDKALWETSGHWEWYRENMFAAQSAGDDAEDKRWFALKPMNCPGHVQIFKHGLKSYRDLPLRMAEFGVVHRYEPSGAMHGLMRVRGFTQDDAHVFCTEAQLADECLKINDLILSTYADFGFEGELVGEALDPARQAGRHRRDVGPRRAGDGRPCSPRSRRSGGNRIKTEINPGEGAFYGPKFEYVLRDAIGRDWQCGTTQVDFNLPERFGAFYIDADGEKKAPVMVHRAICGSMERFIGILIEHFAGQLPALAGAGAGRGHHHHLGRRRIRQAGRAAARRAGLRVEIDLRNEKINYKVREHSLAKVPAAAGGRQEGSRDPFGLGPPARQRRPDRDADRRGDRSAGRRSDAAGRQADARDGLRGSIGVAQVAAPMVSLRSKRLQDRRRSSSLLLLLLRSQLLSFVRRKILRQMFRYSIALNCFQTACAWRPATCRYNSIFLAKILKAACFSAGLPVKASARLVQGPAGGTVDVTISSAGPVAGLVFDTARTHNGGSSLMLSLPGNGNAVEFWLAGEFKKPSSNYGDAVIEAKDKASDTLLASKAVMVRIPQERNHPRRR